MSTSVASTRNIYGFVVEAALVRSTTIHFLVFHFLGSTASPGLLLDVVILDLLTLSFTLPSQRQSLASSHRATLSPSMANHQDLSRRRAVHPMIGVFPWLALPLPSFLPLLHLIHPSLLQLKRRQ
jgi:hypothetical protein